MVLATLGLGAGCAHLAAPLDGYELAEGRAQDLRKVVECGVSADGKERWRMLYFRHDAMSTLYFERSILTADGLWQAQGGASYDPASGGASKLFQLRCATADGGVKARIYVQRRHLDPYEPRYRNLSVDSEFRIADETIVLG